MHNFAVIVCLLLFVQLLLYFSHIIVLTFVIPFHESVKPRSLHCEDAILITLQGQRLWSAAKAELR